MHPCLHELLSMEVPLNNWGTLTKSTWTAPKGEKHLASCYYLQDRSPVTVSCLTWTERTNLRRLRLWRVYSDALCVEWWTLGASCVGGHPAWQQLWADLINTTVYPALSYAHHSTANASVLCAGVIDNSTLLDCDIIPACADQRGWNPLTLGGNDRWVGQ